MTDELTQRPPPADGTACNTALRIAQVCPYDLALPGGVQHQVLGLARSLRALGHEVTVIAPGVGAGWIGVGRAFPFRVNGSVAAMAPQPGAGRRAVAALRAGGFDVVHLHEPLAPSITLAVLAARPAPLVGTFHAAGDRTPYRWCSPVLARLARRLDHGVVVSEAARRLVSAHLGGSYSLVPNGVDLPEPTEPMTDGSTSAPTVLFIGRHERRKGLAVLLEASRRLPVDVTVRVAGDGPETAALQRRFGADPRIVWLGRLGEADKARELRAASVLCVPSSGGESFGVVLLEAMAAGTPVVASDLAAYRAVIDTSTIDGERSECAAVLVPPGDPTLLAAALARVLQDQVLSTSLRIAGLRCARTFGMDQMAARYLDLYRQVLRCTPADIGPPGGLAPDGDDAASAPPRRSRSLTSRLPSLGAWSTCRRPVGAHR